MEHESWRAVVGFESGYEVSDLGRVRSITRTVPCKGGTRTVNGRIRKQAVTSVGYSIITMSVDNKLTTKLVHLLVLEAFVGPRPDGMEACHYDGNKTNNRLSNLRWDTKAANAEDAVRVGKRIRFEDQQQCKRGHPRTSENTYVNSNGRRLCRECVRKANREWQRKRRSAS